jgi:hypothetical protein
VIKTRKAENSRAPSYFSHFFSEQLNTSSGRAGDLRTLYIDRDPDTFRDIALHLQGYHIVPKDGEHFVRLFADSQFYSRKYSNVVPVILCWWRVADGADDNQFRDSRNNCSAQTYSLE